MTCYLVLLIWQILPWLLAMVWPNHATPGFETSLSQSELVVGRSVTLREMLPANAAQNIKVLSASHDVIMIQMEPLDPPVTDTRVSGVCSGKSKTHFEGLSQCISASPHLWIKRLMPNRIGFSFEFKPMTAGLFVIKPYWSLVSDEEVYGQLVYVRVKRDLSMNIVSGRK
jgi:hypothetical protein